MHDWSDNELDNMSREAADNFGPGREMPDWEGLQKRLDKELPTRKDDNRKGFLFLIILCLILSGITSYLLISQYGSDTGQRNGVVSNSAQPSNQNKSVGANSGAGVDHQKNSTITPSPSINKVKDNTVVDSESDNDNSKSAVITSENLQKSPAAVEGKNQSGSSVSNHPQHSVSNSSGTNNKTLSPKKGKKKNSVDEALVVGAAGTSLGSGKKATPSKESPNLDAQNSSDVSSQSVSIAVSDSSQTDANKNNPAAKAKDTVATTAEVKKAPPVKLSQNKRGIDISLVAGVDMSSVKFKYGDNAGLNVGLLMGYRFNNRWSIGTGLIYTKKNYTAAGDDFNPPKGYWTNNITLDKVEGSCYMWELPVNGSYHFKTTKKSEWFITMGLSTYFMKKEDYTYYYKYSNGMPVTRTWKNTDPSNYWFSILGVSGGWASNLGHGLSLGIAPYAKIPLKGVGFGNMQLSSYGLNLLLNYHKPTGPK